SASRFSLNCARVSAGTSASSAFSSSGATCKAPRRATAGSAAARQIVLRTYLESVSTVPEDYPSDAELQAAYQANKAQLAVP
ncbi:hypothetical protein VST49_33335, partial [Pseudomonas aeruginosa]